MSEAEVRRVKVVRFINTVQKKGLRTILEEVTLVN